MNEPIYILGISGFYHDSAACLLRDGAVVAAVQEERFTRKRHDASFPIASINYCLKTAGIDASQLALVAFYEKPFLKFERLMKSYMAYAPVGLKSFLKSIPLWVHEKLWMKDFIAQEINFKGDIVFTSHHESHAASAFFASPYREAAVMTVDGVGEWTSASFGVGRDNHLKILSEIRYPDSLGLLYSAFTYYLGFKVNSGEYKMMGLAPYGQPVYRDLITKHLIDLKEDGSFRMDMTYFNYCVGLTMTNSKFDRLFGRPPRKPESPLEQFHMDVAASIQAVTEEVVLRMARHVRKETGMRNLCLAGGVALNCVGNGRILQEKIFDHIWVQPAAGDAGGALGAALFAWHQYLGKPRTANERTDVMRGAFLGPEYTHEEIAAFLKSRNIPHEVISDAVLPERVADLINAQNVIGWFQGRLEFGPRALGARSILGDPRSPKMQSIINQKIKFRESFRPFAPSVVREKVSDYFELHSESPYMLIVAPVSGAVRRDLPNADKERRGLEQLHAIRSSIPAVTHVDFSARVQTVDKETNTLYYELLKKFSDKHGCPLVINTSFNVRGEPLVCTPEEAYNCFMRTDMDYLVMGHFLLNKKVQNTGPLDNSWQQTFQLD